MLQLSDFGFIASRSSHLYSVYVCVLQESWLAGCTVTRHEDQQCSKTPPKQNVPWDIKLQKQHVPWDKKAPKQNVPRDKNAPKTKRPRDKKLKKKNSIDKCILRIIFVAEGGFKENHALAHDTFVGFGYRPTPVQGVYCTNTVEETNSWT